VPRDPKTERKPGEVQSKNPTRSGLRVYVAYFKTAAPKAAHYVLYNGVPCSSTMCGCIWGHLDRDGCHRNRRTYQLPRLIHWSSNAQIAFGCQRPCSSMLRAAVVLESRIAGQEKETSFFEALIPTPMPSPSSFPISIQVRVAGTRQY